MMFMCAGWIRREMCRYVIVSQKHMDQQGEQLQTGPLDIRPDEKEII